MTFRRLSPPSTGAADDRLSAAIGAAQQTGPLVMEIPHACLLAPMPAAAIPVRPDWRKYRPRASNLLPSVMRTGRLADSAGRGADTRWIPRLHTLVGFWPAHLALQAAGFAIPTLIVGETVTLRRSRGS